MVRNDLEIMSKCVLRAHSALLIAVFVYQALDVWAMGVTLYCFVFGKVSKFRAKCMWNKEQQQHFNYLILPFTVSFL